MIPALNKVIPQVVEGFLSAPQYQTCTLIADATPAGFNPEKNYCVFGCEDEGIYTMEDCISAIANEVPSVARGDGILFDANKNRCYIISNFPRDEPWDCNSGEYNNVSGTCIFAPVTDSSYSYISNPDCNGNIPDGIVKLPFAPTTNLKQYIVETPFNVFEVLTSGSNVDKDIKMPRTFYTYDSKLGLQSTTPVCEASDCADLEIDTLEKCIDEYIALYETGKWSGPTPMDGIVVEFDVNVGCAVGAVQFTDTSGSCDAPTVVSGVVASGFAVIGFELPAELAVDCPVSEILLRDIVDFDTVTEKASALNKLLSPPVGFSYGGKPFLKGLFDFAPYVRRGSDL